MPHHEDALRRVRSSFAAQAGEFESKKMNFSKKEYLDHTIRLMAPQPSERVLEVAAGTCICGRAIAPLAHSVVCLDATEAMLAVGRKEAEKSSLANMEFVPGLAEQLPFDNESFDLVLSRLAFHHFAEIETPFAEMARVLRRGGRLAVIDMEAAREDLRETEDRLEALRDFSHVQNRSVNEFEALYNKHRIRITERQSTQIAVSLEAWLNLTKTPPTERKLVETALMDELNGGAETGFHPFFKDGNVHFYQRWVIFIGVKE